MSTVDNNTIFIHVDSGRYPLNLYLIKQENPYTSFPPNPMESSMLNLGYAVVDRIGPPADFEGFLYEGDPVYDEETGRWTQVWLTRPFTPEELAYNLAVKKDELREELNLYRIGMLRKGFDHVIDPDETNPEAISIDLIDEAIMDLMVQATRASLEKQASTTGSTFTVRDTSSNTYDLSLEQMIRLYNEAADARQTIVTLVWSLRNQINKANELAELPTIPVPPAL